MKSLSNAHQVTILQSMCSWPLSGMSSFQGYTIVAVTLRLSIKLLACALGGDGGLSVTASLCFHHAINCHLDSKVSQTNKNSRISVEKSSKTGKNTLQKNLRRDFSFILSFLETQICIWNLQTFRFFKRSCNGHREKPLNVFSF